MRTNNGRIMTWGQAIIILIFNLLIFVFSAILNLIVIYTEFGLNSWNGYLIIIVLDTLFVYVLLKIYNISLTNRLAKPKIYFISFAIGIVIIAAFIFKPLAFPKEYFNSIFLGIKNIQLPSIEMTKMDFSLFLFFSCLLSPVLEEIFYRRILMKGLLIRYSPVKVILILSIIFGVMHFNMSFISLILLSIIISYIYMISDSIILAIILHVIYNSVVIASSFLYTKTDNFFFSIWFLFLILIGFTIMIIFLKKLRKYADKFSPI